MRNLNGVTREEMRTILVGMGEKAFRADQVFRHFHQRGAASLEDISNLNKSAREKLARDFVIQRAALVDQGLSRDGAVKLLLEFPDGARVESVLIPEARRLTLCVSTQVGCSLNCRFCRTGAMKKRRNLAAWEILEQVRVAGRLDQKTPITNVVFMGTGEPLLNYENTLIAAEILGDDMGMNLSRRRITISTAGIAPAIRRLGRDTDVALAVSLHACDDETRTKLMPINRKYPLKTLMAACREYSAIRGRKITYEYLCLAGINDSDRDAEKLLALVGSLKAHVNLIAFNPWEGCGYRPSPEPRIRSFQKILLDGKVSTVVRKGRGGDILAACGQLIASSEGRFAPGGV